MKGDPPVAEPAGFVLHEGWIDDVLDVPAAVDGPVGIVAVLDLDELVFAPVILSEEDFAVAIEPDQQQDVTAAGRGDVTDNLVLGQQGVLQRLYARVPTQRLPTRRSITRIDTGEQWNVLLAKLDLVEILLACQRLLIGKA